MLCDFCTLQDLNSFSKLAVHDIHCVLTALKLMYYTIYQPESQNQKTTPRQFNKSPINCKIIFQLKHSLHGIPVLILHRHRPLIVV